MTVAQMLTEMTKAKPRGITVDPTVRLAEITRRAAQLRELASLTASHSELQAAAASGQLICWNECKLRSEAGDRIYVRGEQMPPVDVQSALLLPDRRLVTTRVRWAAKEEYERLAVFLAQNERVNLQAALKHATSKATAATNEVTRLELELVAARRAVKEADANVRAAEAELRAFVATAPV